MSEKQILERDRAGAGPLAASAHKDRGWAFRASWLLVPVSWLYSLGARIHRIFMRLTSSTRSRPECAIVSVGAITVGGAGKTPLAARLAAGLRARGYRVVLASRGYKGKHREAVTVVSDGAHIHAYAAEAGDESLVLAAHAPGVPVLVGRDRGVVGQYAVSHFGAEILVLDDGFQHHRLSRDLDIVSLDGAAGLGNARVLPAGPLREPRRGLRRANWICIVDGDGTPPPGAARWLAKLARAKRFAFRARRRPSALFSLDGSERRPLGELSGRRVGLLSGIARPGSFRRSVESLGAEVVCERTFSDHHAFTARDLRGLDPAAELWLTTEKDAIKILPSWALGTSIWVLQIELEIEDEGAVLTALEAVLHASGRLGAPGAGSGSMRPDRSTPKRASSR